MKLMLMFVYFVCALLAGIRGDWFAALGWGMAFMWFTLWTIIVEQ